MPTRFLSRCAAVCAIACAVTAEMSGGEGAAVRFETHVLPILEQNCLFCHSHEYDTAEGGLVLDSPAGWTAGGGRGPAIRTAVRCSERWNTIPAPTTCPRTAS